ncbi:hypothetical protein EXIGLDRAFT_729606, partial [Exidia glandulosa HHB12029]
MSQTADFVPGTAIPEGRFNILLANSNSPLIPSWAGHPLHVIFNPTRDDAKAWFLTREKDHSTGLPYFVLSSSIDPLPVMLYMAEAEITIPEKDHVPLTTTLNKDNALRLSLIPTLPGYEDGRIKFYVRMQVRDGPGYNYN